MSKKRSLLDCKAKLIYDNPPFFLHKELLAIAEEVMKLACFRVFRISNPLSASLET